METPNRRLYEDEIRSVEGPDVLRGGPEGTAPTFSPIILTHDLSLVIDVESNALRAAWQLNHAVVGGRGLDGTVICRPRSAIFAAAAEKGNDRRG